MVNNGTTTGHPTHWSEEQDPFVAAKAESRAEGSPDLDQDEADSPWAPPDGRAGAGAYGDGRERAELDAAEADLEEDPSAAEVDPASNEHESSVDFSREAYGVRELTAAVDAELFERLVPFGQIAEQAVVAMQIAAGKRDANALTDHVFFRRHPHLAGKQLGKGQETLMAEWRQLREQIVQPMLARAQAGGAPAPIAPAAPAPIATAARTGDPTRELLYDGLTPAPGCVETRRSFPTHPPVRGDPSRRGRVLYDNVINQFAVGVNPRYAHQLNANGKVSTYCNIFLWDVTRAMSAEIPHWVSPGGDPVERGNGSEMNANATYDWLHRHGGRFGWRRVASDGEAQALANQGHPTIAAMKKPGGIGHVAVIRPGELSSRGPAMAQAGKQNVNHTAVYRIFGRRSGVELWTNDRGSSS